MDACQVCPKGRGIFCRIQTIYLKKFTRPVVESPCRIKNPTPDVAKALRFGQIELVSLQQLGARLELLFGSLAFLNIDAGSKPLDDDSIRVPQWCFEMEHPSIHPIGPPHSRRLLKGFSPGERFTHLLREGLGLIRMNTGSPIPSQQLLQWLPCEVEPLPIEEIEVSVGSRRVNQRGR